MISDSNSRTLAMGFVLPIGLGFAMLAIQNHDATGSAWKSPYQSYTDKFTPKHRYGFNNAVDTPPPEGPPAVAAYNNWAGNLTPAKAIQNVWNRLKASAQWSLASMPILFGVLMCMPQFFVQRAQKNCTPPRYLRLIAYSILSLHFVHVPYWFDGILHWHYVFETAPLLLILTAVGLSSTATLLARKIGRIGIAWVAALVLSGLIPSWFQLSAFQDTSRVSAAISEQAYSRTRMEFFIRLITAPGISKPALVMVDELGTDPQLSYIINPPDYKAKVLTCRLPSSNLEVKELQQHYPDRTLYVFDPKTFKIRPWTAANIDTDEFD